MNYYVDILIEGIGLHLPPVYPKFNLTDKRFLTIINRFSLPLEYIQMITSSICHRLIGFQRCKRRAERRASSNPASSVNRYSVRHQLETYFFILIFCSLPVPSRSAESMQMKSSMAIHL